MSELKDFDPPTGDEEDPGATRRWPIWAGVGLAVLLVVAFLLFRRSETPETADQVAEAPAAEESREPEAEAFETPPEVELPALAESDPWFREVVAQLSSHPGLARWLVNEELAQRFVAAVDNLAEGGSPRTHLRFMIPEEGFGTMRFAGGVYVDPRTYHRYDDLADVAASLDVQGTAELYRTVRPLLDQAYLELGYPGRSFDDVLAKAIATLLATPAVDGNVELVSKLSSHEFADPALEKLPAAQKHFLRLGPENLRKVQAAARGIAIEIGLPMGGAGAP